MLKKIFIIFIFLNFFYFLFSQESIEKENIVKQQKLLIFPFENLSDEKVYSASDTYKKIFFYSFSSYIGMVPFIDFPKPEEIAAIGKVTKENVRDVAIKQNASIIIYGNYYFSGKGKDTFININLFAYSSEKNANIFEKSYKAPPNADVFETIDEMIADVLKSTLNLDTRNVALIKFNNFTIANEVYNLYIDDKLIASPSNTNFNLSLRIIPQRDYHIVMKRNRDNRVVMDTTVRLNKSEITNIGYMGYSSIIVSKIKHKDRWKKYNLYIDDKPVKENFTISNIPVGIHRFVLKEGDTKELQRVDFELFDGKPHRIEPEVKAPFFVHTEIYTLDFNMGNVALDFFITRYLWLGAGVGFSWFTKENVADFYIINPFVFAGYYLWGDMFYDFRVGIGLTAKGNFLLSSFQIDKNLNLPMLYYGAFLSFEYSFLFIKPVFYFYFDKDNNIKYAITTGIGVKF
jgi:hypothetical protein